MTRRFDLIAGVLVALALPPLSGALAQGTPRVLLFPTYYVADGMPFESIDALRTYLLTATNDFYALSIRDCAASGRVEELSRVMMEVIGERAARKGQSQMPINFGVDSPPGCPWTR